MDLPIDPERSHDMFYRYRMTPLQIKIEGAGNGIKTVFPNLADISATLRRDPEYVAKYFGSELGSHAKYEDAKWIVMGQKNADDMQKCLYSFITKFVLCKECRSPETSFFLDKNKNIMLRCKACGADTDTPPHKISNVISKKESAKKSDDKGHKHKKEKKSRKESLDLDRTPPDILSEYVESGLGTEELIDKVNIIAAAFKLRKKETAMLVTEVFVLAKPVEVIDGYLDILRSTVAHEAEKYVFSTMENHISDAPEVIDYFAPAVRKLCEAGVVTADGALAWVTKKLGKKAKTGAMEDLQARLVPLQEWLHDVVEAGDESGNDDSEAS